MCTRCVYICCTKHNRNGNVRDKHNTKIGTQNFVFYPQNTQFEKIKWQKCGRKWRRHTRSGRTSDIGLSVAVDRIWGWAEPSVTFATSPVRRALVADDAVVFFFMSSICSSLAGANREMCVLRKHNLYWRSLEWWASFLYFFFFYSNFM